MDDFEERTMRILESAWKRIEDAHNSGEREAISAANQRVLEAFEARPISDTSAWYRDQYAKSGVTLPEAKESTKETVSEFDAEIKARIEKMAKAYRAAHEASMESPSQRYARDDSRTR